MRRFSRGGSSAHSDEREAGDWRAEGVGVMEVSPKPPDHLDRTKKPQTTTASLYLCIHISAVFTKLGCCLTFMSRLIKFALTCCSYCWWATAGGGATGADVPVKTTAWLVLAVQPFCLSSSPLPHLSHLSQRPSSSSTLSLKADWLSPVPPSPFIQMWVLRNRDSS